MVSLIVFNFRGLRYKTASPLKPYILSYPYRYLGNWLSRGDMTKHTNDWASICCRLSCRLKSEYLCLAANKHFSRSNDGTLCAGADEHPSTLHPITVRLLDMMIDDDMLSLTTIGALVENNAASLQVLEWAFDNWQPICEKFCDEPESGKSRACVATTSLSSRSRSHIATQHCFMWSCLYEIIGGRALLARHFV